MRDLPTGTITLLFTDIEGSTLLLQHVDELSIAMYAGSVPTGAAHGSSNSLTVTTSIPKETPFSSLLRVPPMPSPAAVTALECALASACLARSGGRCMSAWGCTPGSLNGRRRRLRGTGCAPSRHALLVPGTGARYCSRRPRGTSVEHHLPGGVSLRDLGRHRLKDLLPPRRAISSNSSSPALHADFPPLETLDAHPHNLPMQATPFIGREREAAAAQAPPAKQEDMRLLTLTGPGGSGKTRLGLHVAAELSDYFTDGIYFVNLAPIPRCRTGPC